MLKGRFQGAPRIEESVDYEEYEEYDDEYEGSSNKKPTALKLQQAIVRPGMRFSIMIRCI